MFRNANLGSVLRKFSAVAAAELVKVKSIRLPGERMGIGSELTFRRLEGLVGDLGESFTVRVTGGELGDIVCSTPERPIPAKGQTCLIATHAKSSGRLDGSLILRVGLDTDFRSLRAELSREASEFPLLRRSIAELLLSTTTLKWGGPYPVSGSLEVWANSSGIPAADAFAGISRAVSTWNQAGANYALRRVVEASGLTVQNDKRNIVRWSDRETDDGSIAVTTYTYKKSTNEFVDCDIVLWQDVKWGTTPAAGEYCGFRKFWPPDSGNSGLLS